MGLSKTEINLKRLLAAAPQQDNSTKLMHYVATLREQLAQLTGENTPEGLPSISISKAKEYAEKIEAIAARIPSDHLSEKFQHSSSSEDDDVHKPIEEEHKASAKMVPELRKRNISSNKQHDLPQSVPKSKDTSIKQDTSIKLDTAAHLHIEKHRKLQEDLTDEMVDLAQQLKNTSLMMNKSLLESEKILDSTEEAIEKSLATTNRVNTQAGEVYSQSSHTSCFTWLILFAMTCIFVFVVMLIRVT